MSPEMLYIYTIYQEGSFSRAASKLYLSQPALSIAIRKIENEIGMPLFDRQSCFWNRSSSKKYLI